MLALKLRPKKLQKRLALIRAEERELRAADGGGPGTPWIKAVERSRLSVGGKEALQVARPVTSSVLYFRLPFNR